MNGKQLTGYSKTGTSVTYAYNEDGLRTRKTFNGTTTDYYYNGSVLIGMQSGNTVQRFSYDAQGKVVSVNYNGTEYYYLRNAQGDIVKLIDGNCNTVVEYTYDSWGKLLATTGSLATSLGANQPFRYRGYVYDTETGWYYLQSRYYNPETCRFISSDVLLSTGQGVIGHNAYAYCGNNPINRIDSAGELWQLIGAIVGGAIGFVGQYVSDVVNNALEGKTGADLFKPQSSVADYVGAVVSGVVAGSGIGFVGSIALNTAISTTTYAINCSNCDCDDEFSASGLLLASVSGAVSGAIGGSGANLKKCEGVYKTSKSVLKTAVSTRKIALYTAKIATVKATIIKSAICTALAPSGASVAKCLINTLF